MPDDPTPAEVAAQEASIDLAIVDLSVARQLADAVFAAAADPVVVRVESPPQLILHLAQHGTTRFNDIAAERKLRTVLALGHSTLWWSRRMAEQGTTVAAHPIVDERHYTDIAGGVPLLVSGHLVAAIAVSGLAPRQDHDVVMAALSSVMRSCR